LVAGNIVARVGALVSLGVATLLVARIGGPTTVGQYALLRVVPGLVGVVASAGLPTAAAYFLSAREARSSQIPFGLFGIAVVSGVVATGAWLAAVPLLRDVIFHDTPAPLLAFAGATVATQLLVAAAKSCAQGSGDLPGSNVLIFLEEFTFLPPFAILITQPIGNLTATITALLASDVATAAYGWIRLWRTGFFARARPPSWQTVRRIMSYGARGQLGGVMTLLNLRLDFVLLGSLTGPAVVGTYAVASKFAELLRVPSLAINYVLYPRFAQEGPQVAASGVRRLMPAALFAMIGFAAVIAAVVNPLIPWLYGAEFRPAIGPAYVLLAGLVTDGVAAVVSAWLLGCGRPGINSLTIAAGMIVTVALDIALIPSHQAMGAAVASAAAYLTVTGCAVLAFRLLQRGNQVVPVVSADVHAAQG
jgi:O-antigen/teichoic acid export membrane protein